MVKKHLPLIKKILGDEFLAVSSIILFGGLLKLGFGAMSIAIVLFLVAIISFVIGVMIKNRIQEGNY